MKGIGRRGALAGIAALLALGSSGVGSAAPRRQEYPRATMQPALARAVAAALKAHRSPRLQVIVTGWDKASLVTLDRLGVRHRHLRALPMAFARLTPAQIMKVMASKSIRSISGEERFRLLMNESAKIIGARYAADRLKVNGSGSTVAVVDTGIDTTHADLPAGTKVVENYEVLAPGINDPGSPLLVPSPMTDDNEHGTHVAGTIAGTGELARTDSDYAGRDLRGIAPGAKLIGYSANQGPTLLSTHTIAAFDHIIATRAQTGVRAISNSWGGSDGADFDPNGAIAVAQEAAWRAGIVPVFAAGNSGNPGDTTQDGLNTLSEQCVSPYVVCVAAMTKHSQVVTFSSKGRAGDNWDRALAQRFKTGIYRPTVTAPGVNITAPAAISTADGDKPHGYLTISGTSMSTPMVSGVIALVTAANPKLTPAQIVRILESTADPLPGWSAYEDGAGAVNARRAVEVALAMKRGRAPRLAAPKLDYAAPVSAVREIASFEALALPASWLHHQGVTDHSFTVAPGTERIDLQLSWDTQAQNMYAFLWEPGVTPNDENASGAPFATQESWGLLCDGPVPAANPCALTGRKAGVRYPKAGDWTLRVFGRTTAVAYTAVVTASTFKLPTTTASLSGGFLSGKAAFPAPSRMPKLGPIDGTEANVENPTLRKQNVYFHDVAPIGGLTIDGSVWNTDKPTSEVPTSWHGVGGPLVQFAEFAGVTSKPLQGPLTLTFWAGGATPLMDWDVELFTGNAEKPFASGSGVGGLAAEVPQPVTVTFPHVELAAGKQLRVRMQPGFIVNGAHFAVYYDSVDMPSGMVLPSVTKLVPRGTLPAPDVALTEAPGLGRAVLSWSPVAGAVGYRVYRGTGLDGIRPASRVAQPGALRARTLKNAPLVVSGDMASASTFSATELEFAFFTCPDTPGMQGFDGYVFALPPEASDGRQTISIKGSADHPYDLDVHLYDGNCEVMPDADEYLATEASDESGVILEGAAFAVVTNYAGPNGAFDPPVVLPGPASFTATVTRAVTTVGGGSGAVTHTIAGLTADSPTYVRVAAIDAQGRDGVPTQIFVAQPPEYARIEVRIDGGAWTAVPVKANGSWSVPLASLMSGIATAGQTEHRVEVRARAGEATGPTRTLTASGSFLPVGGDGLPATGVENGAFGAVLLAAAAGLGLRARRRRHL